MAGKRDLLSPLRAAVDEYGMLSHGDAVAVGVSGGKDSLVLLSLLAQLRRFHPSEFSLTAVTLDMGFDGEPTDLSAVAALCDTLQVPYIVERTRLWDTVKEKQGGDKPCSLCAKLRRGALHRVAVEAGCNVVALGHHQNDAAETAMMNLLSGATFGCFSPKSELDRRGITLIRPMIYLTEAEIAAYAVRENLPVVPSRCPVDGCTGRQEMKELLAALSRTYGSVDRKIVDALKKGQISNW